MSIAFGVYDVFSFILPGYLFFFEIIYIIYLFDSSFVTGIAGYLKDVNLGHIVILTIFAYALGHIFGVSARKLWYTIFNYKKMRATIVDEILHTYRKLKINLDAEYWPAYYAIIQEENPDHINEIRWMDANHIMFRNLGFGLIVFTVTSIIHFFITLDATHLLLGITSIFLTFLTISRSRDYIRHYFFMIYSAIVGRSIKGAFVDGQKKKTR